MNVPSESHPSPSNVLIHDNFLTEPDSHRFQSLKEHFSDIKLGNLFLPNSCQFSDPSGWHLWEKIFNLLPFCHKEPVGSFLRLHPFGQRDPSYIRNDHQVSKHSAILFLNPPDHHSLYNAQLHGMAFYSHKKWGPTILPNAPESVLNAVYGDSVDESRWNINLIVPGLYNRLLLFPSNSFQAPIPKDGFGSFKEQVRLTQVFFFN